MSTASLQSFQELVKDDKRTSQAKEILEFIRTRGHYGLTIQNVFERWYNRRPSTITARIAELHEMGYIKYLSNPISNRSFLQYVSDENERETIRKAVQEEKRLKWEKLGKRNGWTSKPCYRNLKLTFK